jgi:hypothetical protein
MDNIVYVAIKNGVVGYFATKEVPEGWKLAEEPELDISDVMATSRGTKEETLKLMNSHWQR